MMRGLGVVCKALTVISLAVSILASATTATAQTAPARAQALPAPAAPQTHERTLSFYNIHTQTRLTVVYRRGDEYDPRALEDVKSVFCDPLCGAEHAIDPLVLDFLYDLLQLLGYRGEVQVVCGYRTAETNTKLRQQGGGVAQGSLHVQGRALDFRLPGLDSKKVYDTAKAMKRGGTGYYKASDFVHIDTGPVRFW
jgi:uncharacterized protein YcbK (DUF882 family)